LSTQGKDSTELDCGLNPVPIKKYWKPSGSCLIYVELTSGNALRKFSNSVLKSWLNSMLIPTLRELVDLLVQRQKWASREMYH
jgi:hypothetical protein